MSGFLRIFLSAFLLCSFGLYSKTYAEELVTPSLEKGYILTPVEQKGENTITQYETIDGVLTPKYYRVDLAKTEYGEGSATIYYEWVNDADGNKKLSSVSAPSEGKTTITVKFNPTNPYPFPYFSNKTDNSSMNIAEGISGLNASWDGGDEYYPLLNNDGESAKLGDISGDYIANKMSFVSDQDFKSMGTILRNSGTIGNITGDFIANSLTIANNTSKVSAIGGAIYNNGTIADITGSFVGNYIYVAGSDIRSVSFLQGGAIYNGTDGTINNISGDFIGNYVSYSGRNYNEISLSGGAISNYGTINNIVGNFIENHVASKAYSWDTANGGAVANSGTIGNITANFVGNYASSRTFANGGAVANLGTIGDITGTFINNYASSDNYSSEGGAIYNNGTINNIEGDFNGNCAIGQIFSYGGAIYNENTKTIGNITGIFTDNYATAGYGEAFGGAIYNSGEINDISGNFIGNYVNESGDANGGAIYNSGEINDISGNFIGNYVNGAIDAKGGAIYNQGTIGNITANFENNYASLLSVNDNNYFSNEGGAIYNKGTVGDIKGQFTGNYVNPIPSELWAGAYVEGGAIYNEGTIGNITANFENNYASYEPDPYDMRCASVYGGAIANAGTIGDITGAFTGNSIFTTNTVDSNGGSAIYNKGTIGNITADFINNNSSSVHSVGGAIYNDNGVIADIKGKFIGNYVIAPVLDEGTFRMAEGGAIRNKYRNEYKGTIGDITADFVNNYVDGASGRGGAIYNSGTIGKKDGEGNVVGGIINSNFLNNYAKSSNLYASQPLGGAIYTNEDLNIIADNGTSLFSGNKTILVKNEGTADEQTIEDQNAVYVGSNSAVLTLKSVNNGTIQFDDKINGEAGYTLNVTGDNNSKIVLNNNVDNAKVNIDTVNLNLGKNDVFAASDVIMTSGTLGFVNGIAEAQTMQSLNLNGNVNLAVDVDLAGEKMDTLPNNTTVSSDAKINVAYLNLLNDSAKDKTDILFASEDYANQVSYTGESPIAYSPIYRYDIAYDPQNGMFTFTKGSSSNPSDNFNPSVLAPSVATQAGAYTTQLQTFNYAFQHADNFMNIPYLDRMSIVNKNKYALSPTADATDVGTFSPLLTKEESAGIWMKPYASFESVPLKNGPKVSNINYGTLVGIDSPIKNISHGFDRVLTGYIGYNGASQRYQGVDAYQNGGILGATATFYKGNFFNATTLSVGATAGDAKSMYGSENYTMLLAGIANKSGYNFEFKQGKIILQPSMLVSYSFVNTFDYNNAAGLRIKADPLNAIQLAPGIKLIGNTKSGWQPYLGVSMIWNLLDKSKVTADDVRLPEMSIKPYVQYGVGVQKKFKDKFTAYGQAMIHSGGRNGISLSAGLRWSVGKK